MNRRQFLSGIGIAGVGVIGGCSSLASGPRSLDDPTVDNPEEGTYYYNFFHDGDHAADVDVKVYPRSTPSDPAGVALSVGPGADGWESSTLQFALRAPANAAPSSSSARILVDIADMAPYPHSLRVTDEGYRVLELKRLAETDRGDSTIPLQLRVIPDTPIQSLSFRSTTRWHSPQGALMEGSFTDRLSMPVTQ
jgi:hypothetical protein